MQTTEIKRHRDKGEDGHDDRELARNQFSVGSGKPAAVVHDRSSWSMHYSRIYNVPYWWNNITNERTWFNPMEVADVPSGASTRATASSANANKSSELRSPHAGASSSKANMSTSTPDLRLEHTTTRGNAKTVQASTQCRLSALWIAINTNGVSCERRMRSDHKVATASAEEVLTYQVLYFKVVGSGYQPVWSLWHDDCPTIVVRPEYVTLCAKLQTFTSKSVLVQGSQGIGKSLFLTYFMHLLCAQPSDQKRTFLLLRSEIEAYFFTHERGVPVVHLRTSYHTLPQADYVISDKYCIPGIKCKRYQLFVASYGHTTAMAHKFIAQELELNRITFTPIMSPCAYWEIEAMMTLLDPDKAKFADFTFAVYGGSARYTTILARMMASPAEFEFMTPLSDHLRVTTQAFEECFSGSVYSTPAYQEWRDAAIWLVASSLQIGSTEPVQIQEALFRHTWEEVNNGKRTQTNGYASVLMKCLAAIICSEENLGCF